LIKNTPLRSFLPVTHVSRLPSRGDCIELERLVGELIRISVINYRRSANPSLPIGGNYGH